MYIKMLKNMKSILLILLISVSVLVQSCSSKDPLPVNLQHALSLVDSVEVNGKILKYIWIYADAPSYKPVPATGEGITCVDDVGRFLEVLEIMILQYDHQELLPLAEGLLEFLLYMVRDDGLWYNFMLADGSINKEHKNSTASFQWWAIRGLRGLAAGYNVYNNLDLNKDLQNRIVRAIHSADQHLSKVLENYPLYYQGAFEFLPAWLLSKAPDQTSELLLVLTKLHNTGNFEYFDQIKQFSQGLLKTQFSVKDHELEGMYFCWDNVWHSWGNNHAYALVEAYKIIGEAKYLESVKLWADNFIPYLIENRFPRRITILPDQTYNVEDYPQIAYGLNSTLRGLNALARITKDPAHQVNAELVFGWFSGDNNGGLAMYDHETGRCFDGINAQSSVNKNSGAESTIECLLAYLDNAKN